MICFVQNTIDNENVVEVYLYHELLGAYRTDHRLTDEELAEIGEKLNKRVSKMLDEAILKGKS